MRVPGNLLEPLTQWLDTLQKRERITLYSGAVVFVIMLFYLAIWDPIISAHENDAIGP